MKKRFFLTIIFLAILPVPSLAAEFFIESDDAILQKTEIQEFRFYLDSQGEQINTISGSLLLDEELLSVYDLAIGGSVVDIWAERLKYDDGKISFTGLMPGGVGDEKAYLFSLYLQGEFSAGSQALPFVWEYLLAYAYTDTTEEIPLLFRGGEFSISSAKTNRKPPAIIDERPPEAFLPIRVRTKQLFGGEPALVFAAEDKQSGIDHYELLFTDESKKIDEAFIYQNGWLHVSSPLLLSERMADSYLYVKAVDKAGNSTVEMLVPESKDPDIRKQRQIYTLSFLLFLTVLIVMIERMYLTVKKIKT